MALNTKRDRKKELENSPLEIRFGREAHETLGLLFFINLVELFNFVNYEYINQLKIKLR